MEICELDESYKGYQIYFEYDSNKIYEVSRDSLSFIIKTKEVPLYTKKFIDTLFEEWIDNPVAYGMFEDDKLIGVIELGDESYASRLRIQELWVDKAYRRNGIGHKLMDKAIEYAREHQYQRVILETQNVNYPAMCFYQKYGFTLIGLTTTEYDNKEEFKGEVRFEMGYILD
ncbi:MAG: GNAT family N-acetyltransferase [Erysipelotrichales bacterium]|nr:GNAT family N-acetyltransferase [Erysipelotrichales bacterium]